MTALVDTVTENEMRCLLQTRVQNASGTKLARDWWNSNASANFQHLDRSYVEGHEKDWTAFLPKLAWKGRRVLDYGIGAGYLGEALFQAPYTIGSYYGVDISQNSLDAAAQVLTPWSSQVHLLLTPQSF